MELLKDESLVEGVLEDYRTAAVDDSHRALLGFIEKLTLAAGEIQEEDVSAARQAGWSEEAIYDAITVCALFNFYTRWCDGSGVHALTEEGFKRGAKEMAKRGYLMPL